MLVGAFNSKKALVGAFSVIVKTSFAALEERHTGNQKPDIQIPESRSRMLLR